MPPLSSKRKTVARRGDNVAPISQQVSVEGDLSSEREEDQYFSRAVAKAFYILNSLSISDTPVTLNEMATRADLTKSSCFRLLHTLERLGYVSQLADGRYTSSEKGWVSSSIQVAQAILRTPQHAARTLNEEFRETVSIAVLFTNHIEVVQTFESSRVLRMANTVGRILPPHASSLGKAITAFQPERLSKQLLLSYGLQPITKFSITDEVMLREEFEKVRAQGYAYEGEESTPDGCCFGAPIFIESGRDRAAVAAISVSMPKSRVPSNDERAHMISQLLDGAESIGKYLRTAILERR